jgi:hypothetical protein
MFNGCFSLKQIPAFDVTSVTNFTNTFNGCSSNSYVGATGFSESFSIASNSLSSSALDDLYTNLPSVSKTLTVTGNYGTSADDPTIATGKGWTVVG